MATTRASAPAAGERSDETVGKRRRPPWWPRWPRWPVAARVLGAALLAASITVVVLQVDVSAPKTAARSCGSPFDVIAGRADWQSWRTQDIADGGALVRTQRCPSAVNDRTATAGLLAIGSVVLLAASLRGRVQRRGDDPRPVQRRLHRVGMAATIAGAALTAGGLVGLLVLVANPAATLFLYASRTAVLLVGLVLLEPGLLLVVVGLGLTAMAREMPGDRK